MTLNSGSRLGAYEVGAPLGAGGMGEVYRARDTRLGRSVAIKVLPAAFATDPERVARFEREAKLLAALNHPHIAALYGMETTDAGPAHLARRQAIGGGHRGRKRRECVDLRPGRTSAIRRLTFGAKDRFPVWSSDGQRVAFQSDRDDDVALFVAAANGGTPERLTKAAKDESHVPESWWGDHLLYSVVRKTGATLWHLDSRAKSAQPLGGVESSYVLSAMFSPDGHWVAYATSDGMVSTVFVQPFPANGKRFQISRVDEDGHHPMWSPDGKELSYIPAPGRFLAVDVSTSPSFIVGNPVLVPRRFSLDNAPANVRSHDITPDGRRFLGLTLPTAAGDTNVGGVSEIRIVLNWTDELKQRAPLR